MADVDDKWHRIVDGKRERTELYGKGKRWRARWRDDTGRQRQESFDKKLDADRHVATVEADMLRRTYIDPRAGQITFKAYAEQWRASAIHEESTATQVRRTFNRHVYPVFGERELGSIKPSEAQLWIRGLEIGRDGRGPLDAATIKYIVAFVVAVGYAAEKDGRIHANPFAKRDLPDVVKRRVVPPTGQQIAALYDAFPGRSRALVALGAGIGPRAGEAFGLEVDCIDFLRRKIHIRQQLVRVNGSAPYLRLPKGRKIREVAAADVLLEELAEHLRLFPPKEQVIEDRTNLAKPVTRTALLVFTTMTGRPIQPQQFSARILGPARGRAELPAKFSYHDLRHYFASALIRFGETVKTVQAALGHATAAETLETYSHLWPDSEDRTRAAIEHAFRSDVGGMWATGTDG